MKIADGPRRFLYFQIGAALMIVSKLVVVFAGLNIVTYAVGALLAALGGAFAFEGIMKVWTQESFPTLLRSTAQGTIISLGRFSAAALAAITPLLLQSGVTTFFLLLTTFNVVGLGVAWVVFRRRQGSPVFETEGAAEPAAEPTSPGVVA
jgi:inositol transporter-like SP family MFS transporter